MKENIHLISKKDLESFVSNIFTATGLDQEQSVTIAQHLVMANLRGVDSHGVSRVGIYTKRYDRCVVEKEVNIKIEHETTVSALIDGGNASGIMVAVKGVRLAVEKAQQNGVGIVGMKNSNHCGMLAAYCQYGVENDCIILATTNAPPNMAPWGGRAKFFGTNPFAYGIPAKKHKPLIFDMATSTVARGKILLAQMNNQKIPLGWAITKEGKHTTDPQEALEGIMLPVGEYKGYGIALLVESLSALFNGASFGPHIPDLYNDLETPQNVGHCFIAMKCDLFMDKETFKKQVDQLIDEIKKSPKMEGVERIYLPGEIEFENAANREANGIPITNEVIKELNAVAEKYGLSQTLK